MDFVVGEDNQERISDAEIPHYFSGRKHIDLKPNFWWTMFQKENVGMECVQNEQMTANVSTESLRAQMIEQMI